MVQDPDDDPEYFTSFKLHSVFINNYHLQEVLLTPSSLLNFRMIMLYKQGINCFPFAHTNRYRQLKFIDINNTFGQGHNAIISVTGTDRSKAVVVAPSIKHYLTRHYMHLKNDNYVI